MEQSFYQLLEKVKDFGSIKSPDFVAYTLPLLDEVALLHEQSTAAFIKEGDIAFNELHLVYQGTPKVFMYAGDPLFVKPRQNKSMEVSGAIRENTDLDTHHTEYTNVEIAEDEEELRRPKYMMGYTSWDYKKGHYDPLTDVLDKPRNSSSINAASGSTDPLTDV